MRDYFFILLLFVSSLTSAQDESALDMSLDDCIVYARANNETLKVSKFDNEISDAQIGEVRAQGLPQLNANIGFTHNIDIQTSFIEDFISPSVYGVLIAESLLPDNSTIPATQTFPARFGTNYTGIAGLSASQLLFDGSYFVGLKAARTLKELTTRQQVQTEIEVVEGVSKAYYLVLVTTENLELLARNYARIDTVLRETQLLYENGFAEKIDVSRIKIQHNNVKTSLSNTSDLLATSISLLKFQMGMPLDQRVTLTSTLSDIELSPIVTDLSGFDMQSRIEYQVIQTNKELVNLNVRNFKSQYLPNIYANFNLGWTSGTTSFGDLTNFNDQTWFQYTNWGLTMNIPIFDGLRKNYVIQQNQLDIQKLDAGLSQTKNNILREIQNASITYNNSVRSLEAQRENMELADEVYEVSRLKYSEGVGSNLEVIDADTSVKESQTNYYNALYNAIIAKIDLDKALGRLK